MVMELALALSGTVALAACVALALLWQKNRELHKKLESQKVDLQRTSKILIAKNLELVDQNISQQKQLETKDDFINIVSHQLRTPITEIKWNIDAIVKDASWKLTEAQHESLELLNSSVIYSVRLIDEIVRMVSVEQGATQLAVASYDVDALVGSVVTQVSRGFTERHIAVSVDTSFGGTIDTIDQDSLHMILSNLVENAFLYTPDGGTIVVRTEGTPHTCKLIVQDTGIGMTPEQQQSVFQKFRRSAEAVKVNARGSGLGLYIIKKIVERHHGTISFKSAKGQGTTFTLEFPRTRLAL